MAANKKGLGVGLDALFGAEVPAPEREGGETLPIAKIEPRDKQPRKSFDEETLRELADSIGRYGLLQPITVRRLPSGYYQIIAGERRWRASRMAGLTELPVRVIEADDRLATELALVENLQREDLNPMEEARGYRDLLEEFGMTQEQVSATVGKSRPAVTNALRLLQLTPQVIKLVEGGALSAGHARALLPVSAPELQEAAAKAVLDKGLSVRKTEELARRLSREPAESPGGEVPVRITVDYLSETSKSLEKLLGRRVTMSESGKRGRIVLEYYGADDREMLLDALKRIKK